MSTYLGRLACVRCGAVLGDDLEPWTGCPTCAATGINANVLPVYDLPAGGGLPRDDTQPGVFRYRELLPVPAEAEAVTLHEGGTPLIGAPKLAAELGVAELWFKDETRNPTWSYKDRLAAVGVTVARHRGADTVILASTGNHGAAVAAYAAAAGLRCVVLTLASVPLTMKVLMQSYGAIVLALSTGPQRWQLLEQAVREWGWVPLSGFRDPPIGSNPFGVDGYKTIAYETYAELGGVPDVLVMPSAYADGLAGVQRGFADLVALGVADRQPRLVAADPFSAYAGALEAGKPVEMPAGPTVSFSIGTPWATHQGLAALRASGGAAVGVPADEETMRAQRRIAAVTGLYLEASSAICLPAIERLVASEQIRPGDRVVCLATSTGLKDIGASADRLPPVPVIDPDLAQLAPYVSEPPPGVEGAASVRRE
jgi:threonine synthase